MIVAILCGSSAIHGHHSILSVVGVAMHAVVRHISRSIIGVIHRRAVVRHSPDSIRRGRAALLERRRKRHALNLSRGCLSSRQPVIDCRAIAPAVVFEQPLRA